MLKYNTTISLSEQQFVDCDILTPVKGNRGCRGGFVDLGRFCIYFLYLSSYLMYFILKPLDMLLMVFRQKATIL